MKHRNYKTAREDSYCMSGEFYHTWYQVHGTRVPVPAQRVPPVPLPACRPSSDRPAVLDHQLHHTFLCNVKTCKLRLFCFN